MKDGMNDYAMQLFLDKKGHKLYDPIIDNQVDNEELAKLAMMYGFEWNEKKELWFLK